MFLNMIVRKLLNVSRSQEHAPTKWFHQMLLPSLKTVVGICIIEKEAALSNTGSNPLPTSVKLYSTLTGYSDTILLLIIPSRSSSRRRSVRTLGDMPSILSMKRLNCVLPLRISLNISTVHLFPIILKVVSIGHDFSSGML